MDYVLSKEQLARARAEFDRVQWYAKDELRQLRLQPEADETWIAREVERMSHEPRLGSAGDKERKWVERLTAMSKPEFWAERASAATFSEDGGVGAKSVAWLCGKAKAQARQLAALLPADAFGRDRRTNPGQYYFWHPVTFKTDKLGSTLLTGLRSAALEAKEWDVKWFCEIMLGGLDRPGGTPESASDFRMEVLCGLRRWNDDVIRLVRLRNIRGEETKILVLDSECFKAPEHFRAWCLKVGPFTWNGNATQVQALQWDTNAIMAWRTMEEVDAMGWHPIPEPSVPAKGGKEGEVPFQSGIWFYGDCAYHDGQLLEMDRDQIYMVNGVGYYLSDKGRESEFALGRPKLRPTVKLGDRLTLRDLEDFTHKPAPLPVAEQTASKKDDPFARAKFSEAELLKSYFQELCHRLYETMGGYESHLALGAVFAYAAAPEIFAEYGLFPGLFVHGQMGSGKTKVVEWLMHLVGFDSHGMKSGISAIKSTAVGILQESQNYSNLPLWIDEFRQGQVNEDKVGIFRDAFNRQPPVKWNPEGIQRKIRTAYVISGESTSSDAATRSRYPHVQISAARRLKNHLKWFTAQKRNFFVLQRLLMERRAEFVTGVFKYLNLWLTKAGTASEREKTVHGIDWAAWRSMADLLGVEAPGEFDDFVLEHMMVAATDVTAETNINLFWTDLISAFNTETHGVRAIPVELFRVSPEVGEYPEGQKWIKYTLYFEPNGVLDALAAHLRKVGHTVSLRRNDLRDQLSRNDYWVSGELRMRFGKGSSVSSAWGIRLDEHPLGRQEVTDEAFAAALDKSQRGLSAEVAAHHFKDGDPRKGPLFAIVDAFEAKESKS